MENNSEDTIRIWLIRPVAIAVLLAWLTALYYSFYSHDYEALKIVSVPFGILAGYVFGITTIRIGRRNNNGN